MEYTQAKTLDLLERVLKLPTITEAEQVLWLECILHLPKSDGPHLQPLYDALRTRLGM